MFKFIFILCAKVICVSQCANILGVFQFPSLSHQVVYQALWRELSIKGHQVTVVTPYPIKDKSLVNLTEIDVSEVQNTLLPSDAIEITMSKDSPTTDIMKAFYTLSEKIQEGVLANKEFQLLYNNSNTRFDLIICECLHPGMYSLAGKFKAPAIGISSLGVVIATHDSIGNFNHPVLYPDMNFPIHDKLTLTEKIRSCYFSMWQIYYYNNNVVPTADKISRKYLGNNIPYLNDIARNVSLLFTYTNSIIYNVRPNIPTVISLEQINIKPPKHLPEELKNILDSADKGVVYFSLGSNVKSANLNSKLKKTILNAFFELPYKILWKLETDDFSANLKNVITRKWFPQQDVLAHPNIKAFVTQGGLQSLEEAISRGVPMVGMPFIGDQSMNVKKMVKAGIAVEVDPLSVTKDQLKAAIMEVAENKKYKNKVEETKKILEDQPMTALERAVWWTEYVIRHKGTLHLKSPTASISYFQYFFLDVISLIMAGFLFIIYVTKYLIILLFTKRNKVKIN